MVRPTRFRSVRATVRVWRHDERFSRAFGRLWIDKPGKRREEIEGEHPHSTVTDGTRSWAYGSHGQRECRACAWSVAGDQQQPALVAG
jgi:outer membrane lipoprotein-sorting protein